MWPECTNVRALSANDGSGTAGLLLVAPLACFPKDDDGIAVPPLGIRITPSAASYTFLAISNDKSAGVEEYALQVGAGNYSRMTG
jgi:hypothetical protein